jgi:hypothetical protein
VQRNTSRNIQFNTRFYLTNPHEYGILRYNQRERVSHEKQQRKKQMNDIVCSCSVCGGPIYDSQLDGETVDENRVYKCGELQYIELSHAKCIEMPIIDQYRLFINSVL